MLKIGVDRHDTICARYKLQTKREMAMTGPATHYRYGAAERIIDIGVPFCERAWSSSDGRELNIGWDESVCQR